MDLQQMLDSLKQGLASTATVKSVYGEPINIAGKTIIPVARVGLGFGAGSGVRKHHGAEGGEGGGGGGGMGAVPVGVLEVTPERTRFIAFASKKKVLAAVVAGIVLGTILRGRCWQ